MTYLDRAIKDGYAIITGPENKQKIIYVMSALRNPKAHSNDEVLTAEEALRRLMFASMLMYKLDEAGL